MDIVTTTPAILINDVTFSYNGSSVLEHVNLTVHEGDFLSIVGPNAGGKTTLLKLILGLLRPDRGTIRIFGSPPDRARHRMGYMPQSIALDPLFPVDVTDVVLMGRLDIRKGFGGYSAADKQAAVDALEMLEMSDVRDRPFSDLSGGQRQRVLIARALVSDPEILLLDEPTANVDAAIETELFDLLRQLNQHMTIVLVTHDLGFVSHYVKSVACVSRRVVVHPTTEITGEMINELYGCDMRMVRHDHREGGNRS
jgi:zinc transport system ATP-binding protein